MVNVRSGDVDDFEKSSRKLEIVPRGVEKLVIYSNLTRHAHEHNKML